MPEFVTQRECHRAMKADHLTFGVIFILLGLLLTTVGWSITVSARSIEKSHIVTDEAQSVMDEMDVHKAEQTGVTARIEQSLVHITKTIDQQHEELKTQRTMIEDLWRERPSQ